MGSGYFYRGWKSRSYRVIRKSKSHPRGVL
jgi:hypothetical protein